MNTSIHMHTFVGMIQLNCTSLTQAVYMVRCNLAFLSLLKKLASTGIIRYPMRSNPPLTVQCKQLDEIYYKTLLSFSVLHLFEDCLTFTGAFVRPSSVEIFQNLMAQNISLIYDFHKNLPQMRFCSSKTGKRE